MATVYTALNDQFFHMIDNEFFLFFSRHKIHHGSELVLECCIYTNDDVNKEILVMSLVTVWIEDVVVDFEFSIFHSIIVLYLGM